MGPEKLWEALSMKFYWPRMKVDILKYCQTCDICQKTKPTNFTRYGRLSPNPIPKRPYESISMDLIVNLPWSDGFNVIFVVVDRFTKHAQFVPTTTGLNAKGFAALFVKHIACRFGLPQSIVSDRDPRWTSDFWEEAARLLRVEMLLFSSHHPQHDGQTKIVNRQLEVMLRAYVKEERTDWVSWLHLLEHTYNSRTHASTGCTLYFLLYGFEPKSALDILAGDVSGTPEVRREVQKFADSLTMHRESARQALAKAQVKQAKAYNKGRRTLEFDKGEGRKLVQRWIGPFEVTQRINENTYRVRLDDSYPGSPVFNIQHLKKYEFSPEDFGERPQRNIERAWKTATEEYALEAIVGHRYDKRKRKRLYLVRWEGYSPLYDTWQTELDLKNAPDVLHEYKRKHGL